MSEEKKEDGAKKKKRRIKNKHWKFVRKTFSAAQLAKSILPGSSHHALLVDDDEKTERKDADTPSPLQRSPDSPLRQGKRPGSGNLKGATKSVPNVPIGVVANSRDDDDDDSNSSDSGASFASDHRDDDENDVTNEVKDRKVQHEISLEIAKQRLLAKAHKKRRLTFLQQTAMEEDFICKTLGMDQVYGRCIRHSNQPITPNPQALLLGTEFCTVKMCRICQSEMRAGPQSQQTSCANLPIMGSVIEQMQMMQSNTQEWDKRTKILGASVQELNTEASNRSRDSFNFYNGSSQNSSSFRHDDNIMEASSSHHSSNPPSISIRADTIPEESEFQDFVEDGSLSLKDLQESLHSLNNLSGTNHTGTGRTNRSTASSIQYTEEEWAAQLSRRIVQVRTWEDRFAVKNHPTFCQYFKMLRMGVPMDAVKSTAEMDGYHPAILDLDPNKSIKMQHQLLSPEVMENLQVTGALGEDAGGPGAKDGDKELSIPETVQKVLHAVRQRRMNQVYATMALFSEMKVKSQYEKQKRYDMLMDEHSKSNRSMGSMPNLLPESSAESTQLTRMLSLSTNESLEMDDEIISQSERLMEPSLRAGIGYLHSLQEEAEAQQEDIGEVKTEAGKEQHVLDESARSSSSTRKSKISPLVILSAKDEENAKMPMRYVSEHSRVLSVTGASPQGAAGSQDKGVLKVPIRSPGRSPKPAIAEQSPRAQPSPNTKLRISPYRQMRKKKMEQSHSPVSPSKSKSSRTLRDAISDDAFGHQSAIIQELIDVVEQPQVYEESIFGENNKAATSTTVATALNNGPPVSDRWSASPKTPIKKHVSKTSRDMPPVSEVVITEDDADTTDHDKIKSELQTLIWQQSQKDVGKAAVLTKQLPSSPSKAQSANSSPSRSKQGTSSVLDVNPLLKYLDESYRDGKRSEDASTAASDTRSPTKSTPDLSKFVSMEEYSRLKQELATANATIAEKDEEISNSVKIEEFDALQEELEYANETIALKDEEINNRVKLAEFKKIWAELISAKAFIERSEETINNSVSREEYEKVCKELKNTKETVAQHEVTIKNSVRREVHESTRTQLKTAKSKIDFMETRLQGSVTLDEYENLSKELDKRYEQISNLVKEVEKTKTVLNSMQTELEKKNQDMEEIRQSLVKKDEAMKHLKHRVHQMERHQKRESSHAIGSTAMQSKIEDEKRRQARLREKYSSPHRVKRTVTEPKTDRDFEALALSPAGKQRKPTSRRRRVPKNSSEHTSRSRDAVPAAKKGFSSNSSTPNHQKKPVSAPNVHATRSIREEARPKSHSPMRVKAPPLTQEEPEPISPSRTSAFVSVSEKSPDQPPPVPVKKPSLTPSIPSVAPAPFYGKFSPLRATRSDTRQLAPISAKKPNSAASFHGRKAAQSSVTPIETQQKDAALHKLLQSPEDEATKQVIMSLFDSWTTKQFES